MNRANLSANRLFYVVTGGRDYGDYQHVKRVLDEERPGVVVQGECPYGGADRLAKRWCEENGVPCIGIEALWDYYGRRPAGPIRNGFDAEWHSISAAAVGLPHGRDRTWIVAYPVGERDEGLVTGIGAGATGSWRGGGAPDLCENDPFLPGDSWPQPLIRGMADGFSDWAHRIGSLGNAVVPQIPEIIGHALLASVDTHAEHRDAEQARPARVGSAVAANSSETPKEGPRMCLPGEE